MKSFCIFSNAFDMKNLERASFDALEMLRRSHNKWKFHKKTKKYALFFFLFFFFIAAIVTIRGMAGWYREQGIGVDYGLATSRCLMDG